VSPKSNQPILFIIVTAQFLCTSLWFAGNAILSDLQPAFNLADGSQADLTSSVQIGFIVGTLVFAVLSISDRFSPSRVFFICSIVGALANFSITLTDTSSLLFLLRGLVGFFLAGIYPVGMKISSDYHEKGLGVALGYLVGALVIGTALPHLIKLFTESLNWHLVIYSTSGLAAIGGGLVYFFVPDGPFRKQGGHIELKSFFKVFKEKNFRAAAFGYFGHMWELYTVWAFVPFIIILYNSTHHEMLNVKLWSFIIIASGGIACVIGGYLSRRFGGKRTAFAALLVSGGCCLASVFAFQLSPFLFLMFMLIWGMSVVADSPQFSTLVAQHAPKSITGTALTIVNSIGFAITIVSLQVADYLLLSIDPQLIFPFLGVGPVFGLISLGWQQDQVVTP